MMKIGIRGTLLLLALGVALPLTLAGFVALRAVWAASHTQLSESLVREAELAALAYERWLSAHVQAVNAIDARLRQWPDLTDLQKNLGIIAPARENWLDVQVVDDTGAVLMKHPPDAAPLRRETTLALLAQARQHGPWAALGDSSADGKPRAIAVGRLLERGGAVILRVDTAGVSQALQRMTLDDESIVAAYGATERPLFVTRGAGGHAVDAEHALLLNVLAGRQSAVVESVSEVDGVRRVYALARTGASAGILLIGLPSATLYEPARRQLQRYVLFSLLAILSAGVAAVVLAGRIAYPIRELRRAAVQFGAGDFRTRAAVVGGGEIAELAAAFNGMAGLIEEREAKLNELDRLRSDFVSSVSHEMRTPLTTIKTLTRVLQRKQISDENRREYLETIATECDRQIELVVNLLDLSRIEAGHLQLNPEPLDPRAIARECLATRRTAAEQRQHTLVLDMPAELPPVLGDRGAMRRVVNVLVENAIKYTPDGGRIVVTARLGSQELGIAISDTGRGIHPSDLPRIFDMFYRGGSVARPDDSTIGNEPVDVPGVGLGLYLARNIAEQQGGHLEVETAQGSGSTFTVWLPLAPSAHLIDRVHQGV